MLCACYRGDCGNAEDASDAGDDLFLVGVADDVCGADCVADCGEFWVLEFAGFRRVYVSGGCGLYVCVEGVEDL